MLNNSFQGYTMARSPGLPMLGLSTLVSPQSEGIPLGGGYEAGAAPALTHTCCTKFNEDILNLWFSSVQQYSDKLHQSSASHSPA